MPRHDEEEEDATLIEQLFRQGSGLVRAEIDLARAEFDRVLGLVVFGLVCVILAAVLAFVALSVGSQAVIELLILQGLTRLEALAWVGGGLGLIAILCLLFGLRAFRRARPIYGRSSRRGGGVSKR